MVLPQVPLADPPGGVLVRLQALDAAGLLFLADMEEKLQHQIAVVRQGALKAFHAVHPLGVGFVIQRARELFLHNLVHPARVQKGELPGLGDLFKKAVQKRLAGLLLCGGGGHGKDLEKAGVDVLDDLADGAALSGGAPSLDEHQHRQLAVFQLHLLAFQLFLGGLQRCFSSSPSGFPDGSNFSALTVTSCPGRPGNIYRYYTKFSLR